MSAAAVSPFDIINSCALAKAASSSGRGRRRNLRLNEAHGGVDEQAIFIPAPRGRLGVECKAGGLHRGAVRDRGMTVHPPEPRRAGR
jgi:hypothetical protein